MVIRYLLPVFIALLVTPSWGRQTCREYFRISVSKHFDTVNQENNNYLTAQTLDSLIESRGWVDRLRIRSTLNRIHREGISTERALNIAAEQLMVLFFGPRSVADRYFQRNGSAVRDQQTLQYQVRTQIIEKGLSSFIKEHSAEFRVNLWVRLKTAIRRMNDSKVSNLLQFPLSLPTIKNTRLPEDLLMKIIWGEVDSQSAELQPYLNVQSKKDLYAATRRIWAPVMILALTYIGHDLNQQREAAESHAQAQVAITSLNIAAKMIPEQAKEFVEERTAFHIQEAVLKYEATVQRPITPEEYQYLKNIITGQKNE